MITKTDLIKTVSATTKMAQKDVGLVLDTFMDKMKAHLSKGESISIPGFGIFEIADRAARKAMNFRTKEVIDIPASKIVRFKAGKALKDAAKQTAKTK